ncbi:helix-turn-helix domain-containing protein [uncultured Prevotella sp.]|uniref:winged helix-turn-helix transcriptional regulator n=1 Tax=uncultured Prevotella sp. TaxID=159272 RepID=UPI0026107BE6|nr:helix-turn-helix domain-containing protein [uncultured Prevotella sp.]
MGKKFDYEYCKAAPILELFSNKWAFVVLLTLHEHQIMRFNELFRLIPSISEKMLSNILHSLATDGLISRKAYPEIPPRVEYCVSEFGETLIPHLIPIIEWGKTNHNKILFNRRINSRK